MSTDILLFTSTHCPHCPSLISAFEYFQKQGQVSNLEIINLEQHPEKARQYHVRSVPWFKIGDLEFQGLYSQKELSYWVESAKTETGIREYIIKELEAGKLAQLEGKILTLPGWLPITVSIIGDMQAPMQARIGVGAILEDLAGNAQLEQVIQPLGELSRSSDARVRGDACHYLGMIDHDDARSLIKARLDDPNQEVRTIAEESLVTHHN